MNKEVRELQPAEFPLAEKAWTHYRGQKADPARERIFGVFIDGALAATARCTRYQGGLEMDCVLDEHPGSGYAREACRAPSKSAAPRRSTFTQPSLWSGFYRGLGFESIPEARLPTSIRERFIFCFGEMPGYNVAPMMRNPGGSEGPSARSS